MRLKYKALLVVIVLFGVFLWLLSIRSIYGYRLKKRQGGFLMLIPVGVIALLVDTEKRNKKDDSEDDEE